MKYKTIKIELSEKAVERLQTIVDDGCFGKSVEETAQRMVESFIRQSFDWSVASTPSSWINFQWDSTKKKD